MEFRSNEYIILRLQPNEYSISFVYQTFGITQYIFFDPRFSTLNVIKNYPDKFNIDYYNEFREKCLKINSEIISFTIDEFVFLAKLVDFVSKIFIGEPKVKLREVYEKDFPDRKVSFDKLKKIYLEKSDKMFKSFKQSTSNSEILELVSKKLNWNIV